MSATVLLVDDSDTNRYLLAFFLARLGLETHEAASGPEALVIAAAHRPDLVLLDLHMPQMDGFETAARLHQIPGLENVPIVAVTANVAGSTRAHVERAGFIGFIPKPIDPETFPAEIARLLNPPPP